MPQASSGSPFIACAISSDLRKSGVLGSTGVSMPLKVTTLAPALMPACSSTLRSGTPVQRALPIAPLASCAPNTRGSLKPRLLPEHWFTATTSTGSASFLSSSSDSRNGLPTWPPTLSRYVFRSTDSGILARW
ncbi:hypothetical protein D3C72_1500600 [compost metagenome]